MSKMQDTWLILGASSSIGRSFASEVAKKGARILLAGRDKDDLERTAHDIEIRYGVPVRVILFDAQDFEKHDLFIQVVEEFMVGRLNVFACFAVMPPQDQMNHDFEAIQQTVNVNYLGIVSLYTKLTPIFEQQDGGSIVTLSSVAGDRGRKKNFIYGSTKAALNTYLSGLRARLHEFGTHVMTIKPGFMDTAMSWGHPGMFLVASPEEAATAFVKAIKKGKDVMYFPFFWWGIMTIIKSIPERIFKKMSI